MTTLENLSYDPNTGQFVWVRRRGNRKAEAVAGSLSKWGYWTIRVNGKLLYAHRLAWLAVFGEFPVEIDHINGNRCDNRIANLRVVTRKQNAANSRRHRDGASGFKGVSFDKREQKWVARISNKSLGYFTTAVAAHAAYCEESKRINGIYHNSGEIT